MDKNEFIKKAKEHGYSDEEINEFIQMVAEMKKDDVHMPYDDIVLIEQPQY